MFDAPVRLMHFDLRWKQEFEQTKSCVLDACDGLVVRVEHIGSTAIPGAIARPTIDVVAGLAQIENLEEAAMLVEGLSYKRLPTPTWCDEPVALLQKPRQGDPTHVVWLVSLNGRMIERMTRLRDYFLRSSEGVSRMRQVKTHLLQQYEGDRVRYEQGKTTFWTAIEDQISISGQ